MTTHTRTRGTTKSGLTAIAARDLVALVDSIGLNDGRMGFLAQQAAKATIPVVYTQTETAHVAGCSSLKPNPNRRTGVVPARGFALRTCCRAAVVESPLATEAGFVKRYHELACQLDGILTDSSLAEFRRIVELEDLLGRCADVKRETVHPECLDLVDALERDTVEALSGCSHEAAQMEFAVAQVARIAVGCPRQGATGPIRWRRANYDVFRHLAGTYRAPFAVPLLIPGLIADMLEEGVRLDAVPQAVAREAHMYMTAVYMGSYWVRSRDLTDEDREVARELDRQVLLYLQALVSEACDPQILTRERLRLVVYTDLSLHGSATSAWWARKHRMRGLSTKTLEVDTFDYEWMLRQELHFVDACELPFPTSPGETWVEGHRLNLVSRAMQSAGTRRAKNMFQSLPDAGLP